MGHISEAIGGQPLRFLNAVGDVVAVQPRLFNVDGGMSFDLWYASGSPGSWSDQLFPHSSQHSDERSVGGYIGESAQGVAVSDRVSLPRGRRDGVSSRDNLGDGSWGAAVVKDLRKNLYFPPFEPVEPQEPTVIERMHDMWTSTTASLSHIQNTLTERGRNAIKTLSNLVGRGQEDLAVWEEQLWRKTEERFYKDVPWELEEAVLKRLGWHPERLAMAYEDRQERKLSVRVGRRFAAALTPLVGEIPSNEPLLTVPQIDAVNMNELVEALEAEDAARDRQVQSSGLTGYKPRDGVWRPF